MPRYVLLWTIGIFAICALFGGMVRALHYDFGANETAALVSVDNHSLIFSPAPALPQTTPEPASQYLKHNCTVRWRTPTQSIADCVIAPIAPKRNALPSHVLVPYVRIAGSAARRDCIVTLYADQAPVQRVTPPPSSAQSQASSPYGFTFDLPQPLWVTQNQIFAECGGWPRVRRALIPVRSQWFGRPANAYYNAVGRAVHFWISPGRTRFYGVLELAGNDPRLTSALGSSSLDQLAREAFNVNINIHPVYDALKNPVLRIYKNNHHLFLTLRGDLQPYATVVGTSNISIEATPVEIARANCSLPSACATFAENKGNKIVVQLRGFSVSSFPTDAADSPISQPLGPPPEMNRDGSFVWYTSVAAGKPESVQIAVRGSALASPTDAHHLLAAQAKIADPFLQVIIDALHALVGVVIVATLLSYAGFWRDEAHRRYSSVAVAAALASVLINAAAFSARFGFWEYQYFRASFPLPYRDLILRTLHFLLVWLQPTFIAAVAAALIVVPGIFLVLRRCRIDLSLRYFGGTALAIFAITAFGSWYTAIESFQRYQALNKPGVFDALPQTVLSDAVLAIVMFALLMVSFRPDLLLELVTIPDLDLRLFKIPSRLGRRLVYLSLAILAVLSASVIFPSSAYFSAAYSAPEFLVDRAVQETANYISGLAVVLPIFWFLCSGDRGVRKAVEDKVHLAWLFAILIILTGYAYLGFPITLLLTFAAIYWIALRPNRQTNEGAAANHKGNYEAISETLDRLQKRAARQEMFSEARDIENCVIARQTQEHFLADFVSGSKEWEEYSKRNAELEAFIKSKAETVRAGTRAHATELAFGMGLETDLLANARRFASMSIAPASVLILLTLQSIISNASTVHVPFFVVFAQFAISIVGYMSAGLGFGLAYPYLRGNIGTVKALWVLFALGLAILPYEFMAGSRPDYSVQLLRWLIFFGTLGVWVDVISALRLKQQLRIRELFSIAGLGRLAAVGAVAGTIATSLIASESRDLLQAAIHHVVPAQYALPTIQEPPQ
ncbi:MAG: hypothetical protein WCC84_03570 [Candidatus Cybelea sp.]